MTTKDDVTRAKLATRSAVARRDERSLCDVLDELEQLGLDDLGALHVMAQDALTRVRAALAVKMRQARERDMPIMTIMAKSGYSSPTTVIAICKPGYRADQSAKNRKRAAGRRGETGAQVDE